ncbi:hypothetical protein DFJ73DRAFT_756006 [Zopfochytrium polystomum]|nr:hypothetical protein DFJ73DRAFT_756006 [Zopfochytrium polystomum]
MATSHITPASRRNDAAHSTRRPLLKASVPAHMLLHFFVAFVLVATTLSSSAHLGASAAAVAAAPRAAVKGNDTAARCAALLTIIRGCPARGKMPQNCVAAQNEAQKLMCKKF